MTLKVIILNGQLRQTAFHVVSTGEDITTVFPLAILAQLVIVVITTDLLTRTATALHVQECTSIFKFASANAKRSKEEC